MKRFTAILLCLILLSALALSANADGAAHMSLSVSNGTVHRGEAFTVTVTLSNDQPVSNGGIVLSYDSSVFELVGGSCGVSNATLAEVSAAMGGGVFMLQTDEVVSGTIFTIEMKVKSDAPFGSYSISGTPSLNIDCGISGTSITVECIHELGAYTSVDETNHESICTVCNQAVQEAHTWDEGTVTQEATCKDPGTKVVKCTVCAAESTETIPPHNDHTYTNWATMGSTGHIHTCTVCGNEETADHTWYAGDVITEATCQQTGTKAIYCADCDATGEDTIPVSDHAYTATGTTDTQHTLQCTVCGNETIEDHALSEEWESNKNEHYHACYVCDYKADLAAHEPGPKATETTDQICTICERVLQPMGDHVHEFGSEWTTDEENHWYACVDCPERDSEAPHTFTNSCDVDCNVCGMTRQITHQLLLTMSSDATGHWYQCQLCGSKEHFSEHTPGPEATITSAQVCTVCQFEIAPVVAHDHVYDSDGTRHYHKCICGDEYEASVENCSICSDTAAQFPWWIICVGEALLFALIIVLILLKKNNAPTVVDDDEDGEEEEDEDEDE